MPFSNSKCPFIFKKPFNFHGVLISLEDHLFSFSRLEKEKKRKIEKA
jgi:hypothetical protein